MATIEPGIFDFDDFRHFLHACLGARMCRNQNYSAGAMAKSLGLSPSHFSEVVGGKKRLSQERAIDICQRLALDDRESSYFLDLVAYSQATDPRQREILGDRLRYLKQNVATSVPETAFDLLERWYNVAVLEFTEVDGALTATEMAKSLGLTKKDVEVAIAELRAAGLLVQRPDGSLVKTQSSSLFQSATTSLSLQRFHKKMLAITATRLSTGRPDERIVGSETFAIDRSQIGEARRITERFFAQMTELNQRCRQKTDVFHVGVQMFRLTNPPKESPCEC